MNDVYYLLRRLADGDQVQSTPELLGLLQEFGLRFAQENDTVALELPLELLNPEKLSELVDTDAKRHLSTIDLHWSLDSTNTFLMDRAAADNFHGYVCLAEQQTAGKGRRGRKWVSPFGKNIYLSMGWSIKPEASIAGLSLAVGACVAKAIDRVSNVSVQLKWPNDILLDQGKAAGILVELATGSQKTKQIVIGVGINLTLSGEDSQQIDQAWSVIDGAPRNHLVAELINEISAGMVRFVEHGFAAFQNEWSELDAHRNKEVTILSSDHSVAGISRGVDAEGNLLLETPQGLQTINAGEVSLRGRD